MMDFHVLKVEPKITVGLNEGKKGVGILSRGKNNRFVDNKIQGFDVGIQDEGENTVAQNNEIQ